jgi:hypothetical protein
LIDEYADDPRKLDFEEEAFTTFRTRRRSEIRRTLRRVVDLVDESILPEPATDELLQ